MDAMTMWLWAMLALSPMTALASASAATPGAAETLLPYAIGAVGALLGALTGVLAWVGAQINARLTSLGVEMRATNETLGKIEKDLRGELTRLDRRVTRVEARCNVQHGEDD